MILMHCKAFVRFEHFFRISKKPSDDKDSEYVLKWGGHNTQLLELFSDLSISRDLERDNLRKVITGRIVIGFRVIRA